MVNILFADNEEVSQNQYRTLLEEHGYVVDIAKSEGEARKKLKERRYDLAILDVRLIDDEEEKDISGIRVAREEAHFLPKIILTAHTSQKAENLALRVFSDGIPPAITIIEKGAQHNTELLVAIQNAIQLSKMWKGIASYNAALLEDYETAQKHASILHDTALLWSILGVTMIFIGIGSTFWTISTTGAGEGWILSMGSLLGTLAGIVTEVVGLLFFRRVDVANQRVDRYHEERIAGLRFEVLLTACENLAGDDPSVEMRKNILSTAMQSWLKTKEGVVDAATKDLKP
jgi:CheY-like chemotaxis protein